MEMIIQEYTRESSINQFYSFLEKNKNIIDREFGSIEKFFEYLEEIDPNKGSENVNTLLSLLKKGIIDFYDIKYSIPIGYINNELKETTLKDFLERYENLKKGKILPSEYKDLGKIKTKKELLELIKFVLSIQKKKKIKKGTGALIYTGKNGTRFYESYDEDHACYIGQGTLWCTAATKSRNEFKTFKSLGFRIITMIPKNPENPREKYQFNLWSYVENYIMAKETPIHNWPHSGIFNYLNKEIDPKNLKDDIYEDLIDFLFMTFESEIETYFSIFFDRPPTSPNEVIDFVKKRATSSLSLITIPIDFVNDFLHNTGITTLPKNMIELFKKYCKIKNNIPNVSKANFLGIYSYLFALIFDSYKILKIIELIHEISDPYDDFGIRLKDGYIVGTTEDVMIFCGKTKNATLIFRWFEYVITNNVNEKEIIKIPLKTV